MLPADEASPLLRPARRVPRSLAAAAAALCLAAAGLAVPRRSATAQLAAARRVAKVFYINCDGDGERRASIEAQLDAQLPGVPRERVACTSSAGFLAGEPVPEGLDAGGLLRYQGEEAGYLTLAIYLSHRDAQRRVAALEDGLYLVLEDDAVLVEGFAERLAAADLPEGFDLVRLGCWQAESPADRATPDANVARAPAAYEATPHYLGGHAELWTPAGARAQLARLQGEFGGKVEDPDVLARTDDVAAFASYCLACAATLVYTDESLPQDHSPDEDNSDERTYVPAAAFSDGRHGAFSVAATCAGFDAAAFDASACPAKDDAAFCGNLARGMGAAYLADGALDASCAAARGAAEAPCLELAASPCAAACLGPDGAHAPELAYYEYCAWDAVSRWDEVCAGTFAAAPPAALDRRLANFPARTSGIDGCSRFAVCTLCAGDRAGACEAVVNRAFSERADLGSAFQEEFWGGVSVSVLLNKDALC